MLNKKSFYEFIGLHSRYYNKDHSFPSFYLLDKLWLISLTAYKTINIKQVALFITTVKIVTLKSDSYSREIKELCVVVDV